MDASSVIQVLIVEDDFLVSKEISRAVKKIGYEIVAEVSTGEEAVAKTCELDPDVILMDIQLPGIDGIQASERIQMLCPTPVIILSAYDAQALVERASDTGVGTYLSKPPKPLEIERAITISMARHADLMRCRELYEALAKRTSELETALAEIRTLKGILPICAKCKRIRDDKGYWNQIESYLKAHSEAEFSHGICPQCVKELYPDYNKYPSYKRVKPALDS